MEAREIAFLVFLCFTGAAIPVCKRLTPAIFKIWLVWAALLVGIAAWLYLISDIFV